MINRNDFFQHPLFNPMKLKIRTNQVNDLYSTVQNWIWTSLPGALILGDARVGKTTAINMIIPKLHDRSNKSIKSYLVIIPKRDKNTIRATYYSINCALRLNIPSYKSADIIAGQVINFLTEQAYITPSKTIVLFIDELQRLTPIQMQVFAEIYDQLTQTEINIQVFFIANKQESTVLSRVFDG